MSVRIMTMVWDLALPDSQKIVMLALADCANDEGMCWPSIATMARKCSKSPRTVQAMIRKLEDDGLVTREEVSGKGNRYYLHPRRDCTPANSAPVQGTTKTPVTLAPHPRSGCTQTVKEPSITVRGGAREARATGPALNGDAGIDEGWIPPKVAALPDAARKLVQQWPLGAYEAEAEAFRLHWQGKAAIAGKRAAGKMQRGWFGAFTRWLISDHGKIMRDAKAGVSFAALAPQSPSGAEARTAAPTARPVEAKREETPRSDAARGAIRQKIGAAQCDAWIDDAALVFDGDDLRIVTSSEFKRDSIESRLMPRIVEALGKNARSVLVVVEKAHGGAA